MDTHNNNSSLLSIPACGFTGYIRVRILRNIVSPILTECFPFYGISVTLCSSTKQNKIIVIAACEIVQEGIMIDQKEVMAKKVQAVARGYISRK